jgi:hypothetical protein
MHTNKGAKGTNLSYSDIESTIEGSWKVTCKQHWPIPKAILSQ